MSERSMVIIGLPSSGKTTYLAALWHLVTEQDVATKLRFKDLLSGDVTHLNDIAARWRDAKVQDRTAVGGTRLVSMSLQDVNGSAIRVSFPDVPGEAYRKMWEERECDTEVFNLFQDAHAVVLFIHADTIRAPRWVQDEVALAKDLGLQTEPGIEIPWHPRLAPTQVQLVDILQSLRMPPLGLAPARLVIMLSAWDKVEAEELDPKSFLEARMPLLAQYLNAGADQWVWQAYGVSAQGGDYDPTDAGTEGLPEAEALRNLDQPSNRIVLMNGELASHDLTDPLHWVIE